MSTPMLSKDLHTTTGMRDETKMMSDEEQDGVLTFVVQDQGLNIINGVGRLNLESNLVRESLNKYLHPTTKTKDEV